MSDDDQLRINVLGICCNIIVIILFASPLSTIAKVVSTRSSASLNRPFMAVQVLNCALWFTYGLMIGDIYVWIPNAIGLLLGLIQLALICIFPKGKPVMMQGDDVEDPLLDDPSVDGHES